MSNIINSMYSVLYINNNPLLIKIQKDTCVFSIPEALITKASVAGAR